jgi:hypothetical protein
MLFTTVVLLLFHAIIKTAPTCLEYFNVILFVLLLQLMQYMKIFNLLSLPNQRAARVGHSLRVAHPV